VGLGLGLGLELGLTLTSDLQSQESYGHDLYTCKRSRSKVSRFERSSGNGRSGGGNYITSGDNPVGDVSGGES